VLPFVSLQGANNNNNNNNNIVKLLCSSLHCHSSHHTIKRLSGSNNETPSIEQHNLTNPIHHQQKKT